MKKTETLHKSRHVIHSELSSCTLTIQFNPKFLNICIALLFTAVSGCSRANTV